MNGFNACRTRRRIASGRVKPANYVCRVAPFLFSQYIAGGYGFAPPSVCVCGGPFVARGK
jgi:hypothetical protein